MTIEACRSCNADLPPRYQRKTCPECQSGLADDKKALRLFVLDLPAIMREIDPLEDCLARLVRFWPEGGAVRVMVPPFDGVTEGEMHARFEGCQEAIYRIKSNLGFLARTLPPMVGYRNVQTAWVEEAT